MSIKTIDQNIKYEIEEDIVVKDVIVGTRGAAVARNVAALRTQAGIGYAELSRRTGGTLADLALRRIEAGHRRVDVDDLFVLASALEVTVPRLLSTSLNYALTGALGAPTDAGSLDDLLSTDQWVDELEDLKRFRDRVERVVDEERERRGDDHQLPDRRRQALPRPLP